MPDVIGSMPQEAVTALYGSGDLHAIDRIAGRIGTGSGDARVAFAPP